MFDKESLAQAIYDDILLTFVSQGPLKNYLTHSTAEQEMYRFHQDFQPDLKRFKNDGVFGAQSGLFTECYQEF